MVALVDLHPSIHLPAAFLRHLAAGLPPACIGLVSAENSLTACAPLVAAVPQAEPATLLVPCHFDAPLLGG